jgi:hypothetical protein
MIPGNDRKKVPTGNSLDMNTLLRVLVRMTENRVISSRRYPVLIT